MEIISVKGEKYNYLLKTHKSRFYISDLVKEIIELMKEQKSDEEIAIALFNNKHVEEEVSANDIIEVKEQFIKPLGILTEEGELDTTEYEEQESHQAINGIFFKRTIMKSKQIDFFAKRLTWLFNPKYFLQLLIASTIINVVLGYFYFQGIEQYVNFQELAKADFLWYALLYYPIAIIVLLCHELGHATPAYMHKTAPKSIGFGFYLVFPVLYADVTRTWELDRKSRLTVNVGGIYMQLMINCLLLISLPFISGYGLVANIVNALIGLNFLTIFLNINPFFKFDGYWLYSDFFRLPNLTKKAVSYMRTFFYKNQTEAKEEIKGYNSFWLKLYSFLYLIFIFFIFYLLIKGLVLSVDAWKNVVNIVSTGNYNTTSIFQIISVIITTVIITVILNIRIRNFYAYYISKKQLDINTLE